MPFSRPPEEDGSATTADDRLDRLERLLEEQGRELRRLRQTLMATVFTVALIGGLFGHLLKELLRTYGALP